MRVDNVDKGMVSFILLTYRSFDGVTETLASLFEQDYPCIEVILSDDGSPTYDQEIGAIKRFVDANKPDSVVKVTYSHLPQNQGTVKNANNALSLAQGTYVKMLGAEDVFTSTDALSRYVAFLEQSGCLICFAKLEGITPDGQIVKSLASCADDYTEIRKMTPLQLRDQLFARNFLPAPAWFAKRELFERYGFFPQDTCRLIEDYPYWIHLCTQQVPFAFMDDVLVRYRLSGVSSAGSYGKLFMEDMYAIYDQCIFPADHRFGPVQPVYNALKRAGLNAYMDRARWADYTTGQRVLAYLRHGVFFAYIDLGTVKMKLKNR